MKAITGFSTLLAEGRRLEQASQWEEAAAVYQKIIDQDAANAQAVPRLLIVYRKLKDYRKELAVIDGALAAYRQREKAAQGKWLSAHPKAARASKAVLRNLGGGGAFALGEDQKMASLKKRRDFLEQRAGGKRKAPARKKARSAAAAKKEAAEAKKKAADLARKQAAEEKVAAKEAAKKKAAETKPRHYPLLFIISLRYLVYPDKLAAATPAHNAYLDKHFKTGTFLVCGLQTPPIGATIVARAKNRNAIERIVNTDPYLRKKWATVDIMEFSAARVGEGWKKLAALP